MLIPDFTSSFFPYTFLQFSAFYMVIFVIITNLLYVLTFYGLIILYVLLFLNKKILGW